MQPNTLRYCDEDGEQFGEVNEDNRLHGRGIYIDNDGTIDIGYFENGDETGYYIDSDGTFWVGEIYFKDGERRKRVTWYLTDGNEYKYD